MEDEMIERVAEALFREMDAWPEYVMLEDAQYRDEPAKPLFINMAKAAIAAIAGKR